MQVERLDTPVTAQWYRSNELAALVFDKDGVRVTVVEEASGQVWQMVFRDVQAFRVTTEECAIQAISILPREGAFFEVLESPWLRELGHGEVAFMDKSRHFVVGTYDEIVEVAAWSIEFVKQ